MPKLIDHDARRTQIAEALWRVVLRSGASGVSIRDVAAEAGISAGSLRHVFPTREALLEFSMLLIQERVGERVRAHTAVRDPLRRAEKILAEVLPYDDARRVEMHVNLALVTDAAGRPGLEEISLGAHDGLRALCRALLVDLRKHGLVHADRDVDDEAMHLHALIDGLAVHLLVGRTDPPAQVRRLVRGHLESLSAN
ncbi:TetR family transcriptional regulator [Rhodococcus rhodnii]|uniref:TetR family transcriptional regulator n=2 Tax=Rhodococcus rhodnii TaxID=38312 RepID=R7WTF3_9NOCA|nr:TetR/AcrR family transcriptional regulator [Rhodococcus rhodnii]EOM78555.1 TetR family transcriptional regulator [Rhodococcus rhodnii LMG 5362]TXG91342.1 TetR family transcriptional regulator [Rhodococcus rhodnii]